jgi:hypothetical protein
MLPRVFRILLSTLRRDMADNQALGARVDLFVAHNSKEAHDIVAAVAAVSLPEQEGMAKVHPQPAAVSTAAKAVSKAEQASAGQRRSPDVRWQRTAGDPLRLTHGTGQDCGRPLLLPLLLLQNTNRHFLVDTGAS